jgi:hypothetical protein
MMAEGVRRMDQLFSEALAAGALVRDPSLDLPPPPPLPEELIETEEAPVRTEAPANSYQVQITGRDVRTYNFAMAHLRTLGGLVSATPQQINPDATSYVLVSYRGSISALAAALSARGWAVEVSGTVVRMRSDNPPAPPAPPQPQPQPAPKPVQQTPPQPPVQPPGAQ